MACRRCGKWPACWSGRANAASRSVWRAASGRGRPSPRQPPRVAPSTALSAPTARGDSAILEGYSDANVAELVDAPDLGSGGETRASSNLAFRTKAWVATADSRLQHED